MLIQVNTDHNVDTDADGVRRIEDQVASALTRFEGDLTRVEVHLGDESAGRETADDIRCVLEARPTGLDPVVVSHHAASEDEALGGAVDKLEALLTRLFERRSDRRGRDTIRGH